MMPMANKEERRGYDFTRFPAPNKEERHGKI
jgi:hypothetical protein